MIILIFILIIKEGYLWEYISLLFLKDTFENPDKFLPSYFFQGSLFLYIGTMIFFIISSVKNPGYEKFNPVHSLFVKNI